RPIVSESQRAEVVAALGCVDYVILFNEPDPQSVIAALQPDVLVKGGDWAVERIVGREIVEARGGVVHTIPLVPGVSTTSLIERIRSTTTEAVAVPDTTHTHTASQWFVSVAAALGSGTGRPSVTGLHGSTAGFALTTLLHPQLGKLGNRSWLIVTRSDETAERLF